MSHGTCRCCQRSRDVVWVVGCCVRAYAHCVSAWRSASVEVDVGVLGCVCFGCCARCACLCVGHQVVGEHLWQMELQPLVGVVALWVQGCVCVFLPCRCGLGQCGQVVDAAEVAEPKLLGSTLAAAISLLPCFVLLPHADMCAPECKTVA